MSAIFVPFVPVTNRYGRSHWVGEVFRTDILSRRRGRNECFAQGRGVKNAVLSAMDGRRASESHARYHPNLRGEACGPRDAKRRQ